LFLFVFLVDDLMCRKAVGADIYACAAPTSEVHNTNSQMFKLNAKMI
jgi:hypothetical protein